MRKLLLSMLLMTAFIQVYADDVMRKEKDGTYVVNTTTLADDVKGYIESTPVEVYIKKNKIVKVVLLKNQETPKYNAKVKKQMVPLYEGQKISKKSTVEVDGVTGATFTSNAVKENVKRAACRRVLLETQINMKHHKISALLYGERFFICDVYLVIRRRKRYLMRR